MLSQKNPHHWFNVYVFFVWFFWVKQQKRVERPCIIHTLGKVQWPLPSQQQVWGCPAGSISQWDWMCASVMPRGGWDRGWCQLLPQGRDVVVRPCSVHCYPEESAGRWIWHFRLTQVHGALAYMESLVPTLVWSVLAHSTQGWQQNCALRWHCFTVCSNLWLCAGAKCFSTQT